MIKRSFLPGEQADQLLVHHLVPGKMVKTASCVLPEVERFVSTLRPNDRFTYVLVNAMGYSEFFGANSNTDYYGYNPHLDFNGLVHDWPGIGQDFDADKMKAKRWPHGYPCFYNAAAYAHHKNQDPLALGFGDVVLSVANPKMKRIELILRVFNDEAIKKGHGTILSRIRNGERVDVSMGTKVPFDLCSICTDWATVRGLMDTFDPGRHIHRGIPVLQHLREVGPIRGVARTRPEYCSCMTKMRGQILPDGRKVFVYNDFPRFFDISFVWIGADRTARVMWNLSGSNPLAAKPPAPPTPIPTVSPFSVPSQIRSIVITKVASVDLKKLGEMDKEVTGGTAREVHTAIQQERAFPDHVLADLVKACGGPQRALSTLASQGIVVSPREFMVILHRSSDGVSPLLRNLSGLLLRENQVFDTAHSGVTDAFRITLELSDKKVEPLLAPALHNRSYFAPYITPRVSGPSRVSESSRAQASGPPVIVVDAPELAAAYNGYRISVIRQAPILARNFLPPVGHGTEKFAGLDENSYGGLYLDKLSMISFLSSGMGLDSTTAKPVEAMGSFLATYPKSSATVCDGIRTVVDIQHVGGLLRAVAALVDSARGLVKS